MATKKTITKAKAPKKKAEPADEGMTPSVVTNAQRDALQRDLLAWYTKSKRDLPWRRSRDPYAIWLSEIMLQQTRVDTVIPYYERFLTAFPTLRALADAPIDTVLTQWSGLGYYRRARMLHAGAKALADGGFPKTAAELRNVPGIGPYTAGAVASIAWGEQAPLVDGNVARVLARIFAVTVDVRKGAGHRKIWEIAGELVPKERAGDWNQALMELGALLCTPDQPKCLLCPVRGECRAFAEGRTDVIPLRVAQTKPIEWKRAALVLRRGDTVLLGQRHDHLVFGGLYEPPMFEDDDEELPRALKRAAGGAITFVERITHVLSHRKMRIRIFSATSQPSRAWQTQLESEYKSFRFVKERDLGGLPMGELAKKVLRAVGTKI